VRPFPIFRRLLKDRTRPSFPIFFTSPLRFEIIVQGPDPPPSEPLDDSFLSEDEQPCFPRLTLSDPHIFSPGAADCSGTSRRTGYKKLDSKNQRELQFNPQTIVTRCTREFSWTTPDEGKLRDLSQHPCFDPFQQVFYRFLILLWVYYKPAIFFPRLFISLLARHWIGVLSDLKPLNRRALNEEVIEDFTL